MGIRDALNSTAEEVKRRLPDPAPLKNAYSSAYGFGASAYGLGASALKRAHAVSPDLSTATRILNQSYDVGSNAAAWVYRTVGVDAPHRIQAIVSEPRARDRIGRTAWNLLDHTIEYGTRPYTGGIPVYKILKEGLSDERPVKSGMELKEMRRRLENLEALMVAREAEVAARGTEAVALEGLVGPGASHYAISTVAAGKPTDVIESFIAGGFKGGDFINEQVIPVIDENQRKARRDFLLCKLN